MLELLRHHTILYVEDEPAIQANIAEYLESYFEKVYIASDGYEAMRLYSYYRPNVLLLDINLPNQSGLEVAKKVREEDDEVRIVMLTAHTEKDKLLQAVELNLTKYLIKPIKPRIFKETMELLAKELSKNPSRFVQLGEEYAWDKKYHTLRKGSHFIDLTEKEIRLLMLLVDNIGSTVGFTTIMHCVWENSDDKDISMASVKNQISRLRKKLPEGCITTVYSEGYRLQ